MHVSQIIMLYILSLYCVICQLYHNITGKRKEEAKKKKERERENMERLTPDFNVGC